MSAKELLKSVRTAERKYLLSKELAERARDKLCYKNPSLRDTQGGAASRGNTYEDNLVQLIELDEQAKSDRTAYLVLKKRVLDLINSLDDVKEREVLIRHYFYYEKWEETADKMSYSLRQIHNIHNKALTGISKRLH